MAVSAIQNATIARVQDFSTIKQNEDNKGYMNQVSIGQDREQDDQHKARQVRSGEEAADLVSGHLPVVGQRIPLAHRNQKTGRKSHHSNDKKYNFHAVHIFLIPST